MKSKHPANSAQITLDESIVSWWIGHLDRAEAINRAEQYFINAGFPALPAMILELDYLYKMSAFKTFKPSRNDLFSSPKS